MDACSYGFSADSSGVSNQKTLQRLVEHGGTIIVSRPGVYKLAGTVSLTSNTTLSFGNNVKIEKVNEVGAFSHVFVNKGAANRVYDRNIEIDGLSLVVNGVDYNDFKYAYGLRGQLAFFYIKDLRINHFRCEDLGRAQYCIHICTFEDVLIDDVIIKGGKDGIHLGMGKRFHINNGVFQTKDDPIALNAHDYATGNPEYGWIENGIIENCHDLDDGGYFTRILAGAWTDWKEGMEVQQSDVVVANGKMYRVQNQPDGKVYISKTCPSHDTGTVQIDGINWGMMQNQHVGYNCGVRNVTFRNIFITKPRIVFSIHFDNDKFSHSYYPGAVRPVQENITFDNVNIQFDEKKPFLQIKTPVDMVTIHNCTFRDNYIEFISNKAMKDYLPTHINMYGNTFDKKGDMELIRNEVDGKKIYLNTSSNCAVDENFRVFNTIGDGKIVVNSDLNGLKRK
jgi:hypothetical protein